HRFTARLFHPGAPVALSDILPQAENLGLRVLSEVPFQLRADGGQQDSGQGVALQVLTVETADGSAVDLAAAGPRFGEALDRLWAGELENDGLGRPPHLLETSRPGVFAVGDVRAGSVKRVASAVGEGSVCIH